MADWIRCVLASGLILAGLFVVLSAVLGLFRFKYVMNRMHAAALMDTLGVLLMLLGILAARGFAAVSLKILLLIIMLWLTSPVASHLIAKLEITSREHAERHMKLEDDHMVDREKEGE
jgi:multicomponent Na+:H+ antiporter subunit G